MSWGEGEREVGFTVKEAGFAKGVGDGGEQFGGDGLGLSARRSTVRTDSYLHTLKPELLLSLKPHRELHQRLDHIHTPHILITTPRLTRTRSARSSSPSAAHMLVLHDSCC